MIIVVVLLAALHKRVSEGDRTRPVQAVADLPRRVAFLGITQLWKASEGGVSRLFNSQKQFENVSVLPLLILPH